MTQSGPKVTGLLRRASAGDDLATGELFPLVYDELRRLAASHLDQERPNHTLQATALVHEAYLRLVGPGEESWQSRAHFFGAAAKAIRRILIDHARAKKRIKRDGGRAVPVHAVEIASPNPGDDLLALDAALDHLAELEPAKARVVELRYFAGLSLEEAAQAMGVSVPTVSRHWEFSRAWLHREIARERSR